MSYRLNQRHVLAGLTVGVLLAFQNCAQPVDDATLDESSFSDNLPFAYDVKVDTIAHMSCSDMASTFEPRAYFTFRAGAYTSKGGLTLTPEFVSATKFYNNQQRANIMRESARNAATMLSLSVRTSANFQSPWALEAVNLGEDIEPMSAPLDSAFIAGPLATMTDSKTRLHYFPSSESQRLIEGSVRFNRGEKAVADTRSGLHGNSLVLTVGFSNSLDPLDTTLRGDTPGNISSVYGTGFYIKFGVPSKFSSAGGLDRVMVSDGISEIDMKTKKARVGAAGFDCPSSYQFMVVRTMDRDAGKVVCNSWGDRYSTAEQQAALNALRRVLRVEDWYVDPVNRCIMPRGAGGPVGDSCYGNLGTRRIQYTDASCSHTNTTTCPHFVSVCTAK